MLISQALLSQLSHDINRIQYELIHQILNKGTRLSYAEKIDYEILFRPSFSFSFL